MLYNLHFLRVVAALAVVYFHASSTSGLALEWDIGSRGVDIFFVISGFIMAHICAVRPEQFVLRRLIRIVPFYWAATLAIFLAAAFVPHYFRSTTADLNHLLASLAFLPHRAANGEMEPTLVLGWSLNYEMFFYVVLAVALKISSRWAAPGSALLLALFVLVVHALGTANEFILFYGRPIVLEFCFGILAFYGFEWCNRHREMLRRVHLLKIVLVLTCGVGLAAIALLEHLYRDTLPRHLIAGVPAFFVVLSAVLLESLYGVSTRSRSIFWLGEASYIVYLIHPYIVFTFIRLALPHATELSIGSATLVIACLLVATSVISIAVHLYFERPVMALLKTALLDKDPAGAQRRAPERQYGSR